MKPILSIIIVNYNTKDLVRSCIDSLIDSKQVQENKWEIIIVDNASQDGSVEMMQSLNNIVFIKNQKNVGFSKANNLGIKKAQGEVVLLLNSDTQVKPRDIQKTLEYFLSEPTIGVITCKVVLPNGNIDPASHRGFPTPWAAVTYFLKLEKLFPKTHLFGQYHQGYKDMTSVHDIDSPTGAFYMVRKKTIEDVGLLDEDYFMYGEDLDWSYRIKQKGWRIVYYPFAQITHIKNQSGRKHEDENRRKTTDRYFYETMKLFYEKHFITKYPGIVNWLVMSVLNFRLIII